MLKKKLCFCKVFFQMLSFPKDDMYSKTRGAKRKEIGKCSISNLASFPFMFLRHLLLVLKTLHVILLQKPRSRTAWQSCLLLPPSVLLSWLADKRIPQRDFSCLHHKGHM